MTIEKTTPTKLRHNRRGYTTLITDVINRIQSAEAMSIWVYLQAKPESWIIRKTDIMKKLALGRDRYTKGMNELKGLGLLTTEIQRDEKTGTMLGRTLNCYSDITEVSETRTSVKYPIYTFVDNSVDNPSDRSAGNPTFGKPDSRETSPLSNNILLTNEKTVQSGCTQDKKNTKDESPGQILEFKNPDEWADWFEHVKGFTGKHARSIKSLSMYRYLFENKIPQHIVKAAIKKAHIVNQGQPDQPVYYQKFIQAAFGEFKKTYVPPPQPKQWYDDDDAVFKAGKDRGMEYTAGTEIHEYKRKVIEAVENEQLQGTG